jgi:hypothetical protein
MARGNKIKRVNTMTIIVILVIAAAFMYYFIAYVPGKQQEVDGRNFRNLLSASRFISEKIFYYKDMIKREVDGKVLDKTEGSKIDIDSLMKQLNNSGKAGELNYIIARTYDNKPCSDSLHTRYSNGKYRLIFTIPNSFKETQIKITSDISIADFVKPLLRDNSFDNYLIFDEKNLIYESMPSGIGINKRNSADSLLNLKSGIKAGTVKDLVIGGIAYKVYTNPIRIGAMKTWIFCGMVESSKYEGQKKMVPLNSAMILSLFALLLFLSLPFLKLLFMGENESLGALDIIQYAGSVIIWIVAVTVIVMDLNYYYGKDKKVSNTQLTEFAARIDVNFIKEIRNWIFTVKEFKKVKLDAPYGLFDTAKFEISGADKTLSALLRKKSKIFTDFHDLSWISEQGIQKFKLSPGSKPPTTRIDVGFRGYFSDFKNRRTLLLDSDNFTFQSIFSPISGSYEAVLCMKDTPNNYEERDSISIMALSGRMQSVMNPIVPPGYGFAIIDQDGDVWFDSDSNRIHNQDFMQECTDSATLYSAIQSHAATSFSTDYEGSEREMFIRPVQNIPLFIITYKNRDIPDAVNTDFMSFTIFLVFIYLLLFALLSAVFALIKANSGGKLKARPYLMEWFAPSALKIKRYRSINNYLLITLGILIIFEYYFCSGNLPLEAAAFFLCVAVVSFTFIYLVLNYDKNEPPAFNNRVYYILACIISILLINITYILYATDNYRINLFAAEIASFLILGLSADKFLYALHIRISEKFRQPAIVGIAHYIIPEFLRVKIVRLTNNSIAFWVKVRSRFPALPITAGKDAPDYFKSYIFMYTNWLIAFAAFPVILFFILSFNLEMQVFTRYSQAGLYKKLSEAGVDKLPVEDYSSSNKNSKILYSSMFFNTTIGKHPPKNIVPAPDVYQKASAVSDFYSGFKPGRNTYNLNSRLMMEPHSDQCLTFSETRMDSCTGSMLYAHKPGSASFYISSRIPYFIFPWPWKSPLNFFLWFDIILIFIFLYYFLRFFAARLYVINLNADKFVDDPRLNIICDNKFRNVFITGLPMSGKREYVIDQLLSKCKKENGSAPDIYYIDFRYLSESIKLGHLLDLESGRFDFVVFTHFEYDIKDRRANLLKLELIEAVTAGNLKPDDGRTEFRQIIILSSMHLTMLADEYSFDKADSKDIPSIIEQRYRWAKTIGSFTHLYYNLHRVKDIEDNTIFDDQRASFLKLNPKLRKYLIDLIRSECDHGLFLAKFKTVLFQYIMDILDKNKGLKANPAVLRDEVILKLQDLAEGYYITIWYSLSKEERRMIFDMSKDGIVNPKNNVALHRLISKGVIVNQKGLRLMNESFRNFVLTIIKPSEARKIEEEQVKSGYWNAYRIPLLLVMVAILAFVFFTQQEAFNQIIILITALGSAIPLILRVTGFVGSASMAKNESPAS